MNSQFELSTLHRNQLTKALQKHGCRNSAGVTFQMEELAREFHQKFFAPQDRTPAIESLGEAQRILHHANIVCEELDLLNEDTRRRLERERRRREELLSFNEYKVAMNDVCMFAIYAMEKGETRVLCGPAPIDVALRQLVAKLISLWVKSTGRRLPLLPLATEHQSETWKHQRALERHPIWIILAGLGIELSGYALEVVVEAASNDGGDETSSRRTYKKAHR